MLYFPLKLYASQDKIAALLIKIGERLYWVWG